jgi:hypothetical protein
VFLFDGDESIFAIVDQTKFVNTNSLLSTINENSLQLEINSILIVNKIGFVLKSNFSNTILSKFSNDESSSFIVLEQVTVIGFDSNDVKCDKTASSFNKDDSVNSSIISQKNTQLDKQSQVLSKKNNKSNEEDENDESIQCDMLPSDNMNVCVSNLNENRHKIGLFKLKLWLCDKTSLDYFNPNKSLFKKPIARIRFRFMDTTGYIEAIAYNQIAECFESLELNKWYQLENIFLNQVQIKGRSWPPHTTSSIYDIILNTETNVYNISSETSAPIINSNNEQIANQKFKVEFVKLKINTNNFNDEIKQVESNKRLVSSLSNCSISNDLEEKRIRIVDSNELNLPITSTPIESVAKGSNSLNSIIYTPLNIIEMIQLNKIVNVYGYIIKLRKSSKIASVCVKDITKAQVEIIMDVDDFNTFELKHGNVIVLTNVKVTNSNGQIVLCVLANMSNLITITSESKFEYFSSLVKLYAN